MCEPGLISAGLSIGGQVGGYLSESGRASANKANAQQAYMMDMAQIALRMQQERTQAATKVYYMNKEKTAVANSGRVAASEMAIGGNTINSLLNDLEMQNNERVGIVRENSDASVRQLFMTAAGAKSQMESRIASLPQPSLAGLAIGVANAGLRGYNLTQQKDDTNTLRRILNYNGD